MCPRVTQNAIIKNEEDFRFYSDGITRVRNFIHSERYNMIGAVRDASKAAYAAACAIFLFIMFTIIMAHLQSSVGDYPKIVLRRYMKKGRSDTPLS